ncbi:MAG: hypothetical protein EOO04_09235 [Chitinophagaceae bacterium]|nr:MAG: hypothetical protein EOO04_09235 [Chitinophagaceae bacterium]
MTLTTGSQFNRYSFINIHKAVVGIFRQKSQGNAVILIIYAMLLKFSMFLYPRAPVRHPGDDHYLYIWLLDFLEPLKLAPTFYSFISFVILYIQATLFNRICNAQKMLPKPNFLPAMAYLLLTSLIPEWNYFSAPLLINLFLIWTFYRMTNLYNTQKPGASIFNIGIIMGVVTLLYQPAIVFVILLLLALFIMRPFRIQEWLIGLLGVTLPYYFLLLVLYLGDNWHWQQMLPTISFRLPTLPSSLIITLSIALLVFPFVIGGLFVQNNLSKMLIQGRKNWSLLLLFLIMSMLIIVVNGGENNYVNWALSIMPLAAFHAAAYYYPQKKLFPVIMHYIIFAFALYVNYFQR